MERDEASKHLLETIRKELASMIEDGSEDFESHLIEENKTSQSCNNESEIYSASTSTSKGSISPEDDLPPKNEVLSTSNVSNINDSIQKLQNNLDDSCKTFKKIAENFENINFGGLQNRIKDLQLNEENSDSFKPIFNDLKQTFDMKYMENRLEELTKEVASKFREHPGEFSGIPEISDFFRTCSRLEHELQKLRQQRNDCMCLQNRMLRITEASYDRVNNIQKKVIGEGEEQQDAD